MSRYRTVYVRFWQDEKTVDLSSEEKLAWLYMLTGPQTTQFGLYVACPETMGIASGIGMEAFRRAFVKACKMGFVEYDEKVRLVYVPNFAKHNPPASVNAIKSWAKTFTELPESVLQVKLYDALKAITEGIGDGFAKAYAEIWPIPKGKA